MKANFLKKGMVVVALASVLATPVETVFATEGMTLTAAIKEVNS